MLSTGVQSSSGEATTPPPLKIQQAICRGVHQEPCRSTRSKKHPLRVSSGAEDEYIPPPPKKAKVTPSFRSKGAPRRKPAHKQKEDSPPTKKLPTLPPVPETESLLKSLSSGPNPSALAIVDNENIPNDVIPITKPHPPWVFLQEGYPHVIFDLPKHSAHIRINEQMIVDIVNLCKGPLQISCSNCLASNEVCIPRGAGLTCWACRKNHRG